MGYTAFAGAPTRSITMTFTVLSWFGSYIESSEGSAKATIRFVVMPDKKYDTIFDVISLP